MAKTPTSAKKASLKVTAKKFDERGKIVNWSHDWGEARELEALVLTGRLDGLTASQILKSRREQFGMFNYRPFSSGLKNIRMRHNKEVIARSAPTTKGGKCECSVYFRYVFLHYFSLTSYFLTSIDKVLEQVPASECEEIPEDKQFRCFRGAKSKDGGVAPLSHVDQVPAPNHKSPRCSKAYRSSMKPMAKHGSGTSVALPHVMDIWHDQFLNKRCSLQICLLSGQDPQAGMWWRISTNQREFVIYITLDDYMMTPEAAFNRFVYRDKRNTIDNNSGHTTMMTKDTLNVHPKAIARRKAIAKLMWRDPTKKTFIVEQRISLPFSVNPRYVSKAEDAVFHGVRVIETPRGVKFLHVELMGVNTVYTPPNDVWADQA